MAVDVCSDISSPTVSPRISFSHDLKETDFLPANAQSNPLLLNPTIDFDFCIVQDFSHDHHLSSADELFANGKILPLEVKKTSPISKEIHQSDPNSPHSESRKVTPNPTQEKTIENANENTQKKRLIEFLSTSFDGDEEDIKPVTKPFWQFRRSSSLNCENGRGNGLLRSLQFLTRSHSTGSVQISKPSGLPKVMQKQNSLKEASNLRPNSPVYSPNQYCPYNSTSRKPALKKNSSRSYGNGLRINPVLNIPTTYIAKGTVNLFGIGSLFSSKKSKKKKN